MNNLKFNVFDKIDNNHASLSLLNKSDLIIGFAFSSPIVIGASLNKNVIILDLNNNIKDKYKKLFKKNIVSSFEQLDKKIDNFLSKTYNLTLSYNTQRKLNYYGNENAQEKINTYLNFLHKNKRLSKKDRLDEANKYYIKKYNKKSLIIKNNE